MQKEQVREFVRSVGLAYWDLDLEDVGRLLSIDTKTAEGAEEAATIHAKLSVLAQAANCLNLDDLVKITEYKRERKQ